MATVEPRYSLNHGRILNIQRMSTEDGPGLRTTVFFKGCPLECFWCHNPESISPRPQVLWSEWRCIGCRTCEEVCPRSLERPALPAGCENCGRCVEGCPAGAMELLGRERDVRGLVEELLKDRAYYDASGGGVTLSGGEPTLQPAFAETLMTALRSAGVHVALDTCGLCATKTLLRLSELADLVLFDVKEMDNQQHRRFTGQSNARIMQNIIILADTLRRERANNKLWVRTPLIPGATATTANLSSIGQFLSRHLDGVLERWDLCAFNNLCRRQYKRLGLRWALEDTPLLTVEELERLARVARESGVDPSIVHVSGPTRIEDFDERGESASSSNMPGGCG